LQSYKNEIRMTYQTDNWRVCTHQEEPLHMCSWCGGARHARKFCMGLLGNSIMGVCQYPGRCYHSEACMAGVGNDVTSRDSPHWKYLTAPLSEPACIKKTSFIQTHVTLFFRSMLTVTATVRITCVESKHRRLSDNKIILNLKRSIDQSSRRISRR